ncbi:MAG: diguanylate cyclase (GGDEF)-like protein [Paraglaciecola sp.]|jgi:diguanylate cyclase (GGDEF)-like protein
MKTIHESLSTLPNRFAFLDKIDQLLTSNPSQSLLLIDVVRFSDVSSNFGYEFGDHVLLEIANRIVILFDNDAVLGRISGDIFGLVIPGGHSRSQLRAHYNHLVEHFKTPIACHDHAFIADFNVGAVVNSDNNTDINSYFSRAESALKLAKESKFENFQTVDTLDKLPTGRSLTLKADLTRAFSQDELEIYLQPKIDLISLEVIGAECLLRWNHPLDGVLFPGALIEAAESYNMMNELGYWALEAAFKAAVYLNSQGLDLKISVNMSPTQLYDLSFTNNLLNLSKTYGVSLSQFELELTEDVALSNSFLVKKQLTQIRALGMAVAIDDFGKGYSNLAYMRDIEIDTIKIDKTFIMQLSDSPVNRAIVEATQLIAKAANCAVVAEGIETLEHLHILRDIGINQGQGFLFSKAVAIDEFVTLAFQEISVGTSLSYQSRAG